MQGTVQQSGAISGMQALIVSTATRVEMGNLVDVVAAISAGGADAVFWMWLYQLWPLFTLVLQFLSLLTM